MRLKTMVRCTGVSMPGQARSHVCSGLHTSGKNPSGLRPGTGVSMPGQAKDPMPVVDSIPPAKIQEGYGQDMSI
jgi:hypothetical protein